MLVELRERSEEEDESTVLLVARRLCATWPKSGLSPTTSAASVLDVRGGSCLETLEMTDECDLRDLRPKIAMLSYSVYGVCSGGREVEEMGWWVERMD
jgi:hypothetical protein